MYRKTRRIDCFNEFIFSIGTFGLFFFTDYAKDIEQRVMAGWVVFWLAVLVFVVNAMVFLAHVCRMFYLCFKKLYLRV